MYKMTWRIKIVSQLLDKVEMVTQTPRKRRKQNRNVNTTDRDPDYKAPSGLINSITKSSQSGTPLSVKKKTKKGSTLNDEYSLRYWDKFRLYTLRSLLDNYTANGQDDGNNNWTKLNIDDVFNYLKEKIKDSHVFDSNELTMELLKEGLKELERVKRFLPRIEGKVEVKPRDNEKQDDGSLRQPMEDKENKENNNKTLTAEDIYALLMHYGLSDTGPSLEKLRQLPTSVLSVIPKCTTPTQSDEDERRSVEWMHRFLQYFV
ncbi:CYFA0S01e19471g1_1 [Cyberlindnera fabianii]|uniref:CYFA0S01e19471g1_1 n=1 Tax=Cyberlindnera fabianii TaxID=36022 RepID=A0A061ALF7_CYBFA|nr:CYFA0S01e19471g1_1 [Cyberlindnera fabianii]